MAEPSDPAPGSSPGAPDGARPVDLFATPSTSLAPGGASVAPSFAGPETLAELGVGADGTPRRRRGSRGGKKRRKKGPAGAGGARDPESAADDADETDDGDELDLDLDVSLEGDANGAGGGDGATSGAPTRPGPARQPGGLRAATTAAGGAAPAGAPRTRRGPIGDPRGTRSPNAAGREGEPGAPETFVAPVDPAEYDRRPADLPDRPNEGVPSAQAAETATVSRPSVGDSRPIAPAPAPGTSGTPGRPPVTGEVSGDRPRRDRPRKTREAAPAEGPGDGAARAPGERPRRPRPEAVASGGRARDDGELDIDDALDKRKGRERKGRPVGRYLMCVHVRPEATQIAVLEGRALIEHYVSRPADSVGQIHGNVYLGRVQNVLPGMEAAFIDIGTPKNAVLYRGDIQFDATEIEGPGGQGVSKKNLRIEQLLRNGQTIVCQVTKNPIGSKGARLTQEVSLPGRFCVLVPNSDTYGISKRLADDERKRLRRILDEIRPAQHGLIVRTAAEGASDVELRNDLQLLLRQWETIEAKAKKARGPALLYREPDMAVRVIREEFNRNYRGVIIDDRGLYEEVRQYVESISPELADRVDYFDPAAEALPLFERHHVHEQLHKAVDRKVWLPSGGSLIIERTEALTVIDVNTGKNVGSTNLEETVFRNNLEAADEIARQLRLRDIGGIIVIDFIDMEVMANRAAVIQAFREALSRDKTRTQVFDISELGLVEMTRKRIGEGLVESLSETCPHCGGRGFVVSDHLF